MNQSRKKLMYLTPLLLVTINAPTQHLRAEHAHSPMLTGFLGLNTIPSARMDKAGTIRASLTASDPYLNASIGVQIADPLFINFRQSVETSNLLQSSDRVFPGVDLKLRLLKEDTYKPEVSLGIQSALGHKRQAGEFIAASKRYNNFDFTAGVGWGRFGTAAHIDNPLKLISSHFGDERDINGESPNTPADWFAGDKIGFFGGVEYFLPVKGLSIKADYGADRYTAEQEAFNFEAPSPYALGLNYNHKDWLSASVALQGTNRALGRLTVKTIPKRWKTNYSQNTSSKQKVNSKKSTPILTSMHIDNHTLFASLQINDHTSTPHQINRAIHYIENEYTEHLTPVKAYEITTKKSGLKGNTIHILRKELENTSNKQQYSPEEIWKNTKITSKEQILGTKSVFLAPKSINNRPILNIEFENQLSLAEEDTGLLHRSSALLGIKATPKFKTYAGGTLRLNLIDNLGSIEDIRPPQLFAVRSDVNDFTQNRISLENLYFGKPFNITPELHGLFLGGYLEEFYAGTGAEILYRPKQSRFALGAELWSALRRDPNSLLNIGIEGTNTITGHANIWYDIPHYDITANLRAGRFLAGDLGIEFGLQKRFKNGIALENKIALSNRSDPDAFGDSVHAYNSFNITVPFRSLPHIDNALTTQTKIEPFGRNAAQRLRTPLNLYDLTENLSDKHITNRWNEIKR